MPDYTITIMDNKFHYEYRCGQTVAMLTVTEILTQPPKNPNCIL